MSAANHVDGAYGWTGTRAARAAAEWIGKHRSESRAFLGLRRMFYTGRHRSN